MTEQDQPKTLSKEEWDYFENQLGVGVFGRIEMLIDGFKVTFCRGLISKNRIDIQVFVDGIFKAIWCDPNNPAEVARKFCRLKSVFLYKSKERASMKRLAGKKWAEKKFSYYHPIWFSSKNLRTHLLKTSSSMEIIKKEKSLLDNV